MTQQYITHLNECIKANKAHSIDPFEVFERMKKSAIEAYIKTRNEENEEGNMGRQANKHEAKERTNQSYPRTH